MSQALPIQFSKEKFWLAPIKFLIYEKAGISFGANCRRFQGWLDLSLHDLAWAHYRRGPPACAREEPVK